MPELHSPSPVETPPPPISATLDVQKHDLPPEVRSYADNLEAQITAIWAQYGCATWEEFQVMAQDSQRIPIEKMKEVSLLIQTLARITEHPETYIPPTERMRWFKDWYKTLGFDIEIPTPDISPDEIHRRSKLEIPQALFYRPATKEMSYEDFMKAVKQGNDWTVTKQSDHAKMIGWEPTETGSWFWAEVSESCPRIGTSGNDLTASIRLLSLEEYVILWHATKALTGTILDRDTSTYLRTTRFGSGTLDASGIIDAVGVGGRDAAGLAVAYENEGGRASEVVKAE